MRRTPRTSPAPSGARAHRRQPAAAGDRRQRRERGVRATGPRRAGSGAGCSRCAPSRSSSAARADALPSAVLSLLVTDLPTFVWWQGATARRGEVVLGDLAGLRLERRRFRTSSSLEGVAGVGRARRRGDRPGLAAARALAGGDRVGLRPGRPRRPALDRSDRRRVGPGPVNEARLLAGWLRSRLDRDVELEHEERPARRAGRRALRRLRVRDRAAAGANARRPRLRARADRAPDSAAHPRRRPRCSAGRSTSASPRGVRGGARRCPRRAA